MNAHAVLAEYNSNFNKKSFAAQINGHKFSNLPVQNGKLDIGHNQALYLYGGRAALIKALDKWTTWNTIETHKRFGLALYRATITVGTLVDKEKQLLMLTHVEHGPPDSLEKLFIPMFSEKSGESTITLNDFKRQIAAL